MGLNDTKSPTESEVLIPQSGISLPLRSPNRPSLRPVLPRTHHITKDELLIHIQGISGASTDTGVPERPTNKVPSVRIIHDTTDEESRPSTETVAPVRGSFPLPIRGISALVTIPETTKSVPVLGELPES